MTLCTFKPDNEFVICEVCGFSFRTTQEIAHIFKECEGQGAHIGRNAGPVSADPPDFSCVHRKELVRSQLCVLCGGREEQVEVFRCIGFEPETECSIHSAGIRVNGKATTPLVPVCISCDHRNSSVIDIDQKLQSE